MVITNIWALPIAALIIIVLLIGFIYQVNHVLKSKKLIIVPETLPVDGFLIPMMSARWGRSEMLNIEGNKFNPSIKLFDDHFDLRIMSKFSYKYSDIKDVGYIKDFMVLKLVITFNNTDNNYFGYLNQNNLSTLLKFFQSKECKLTDRALAFLSSGNL